MENKYKVSLSRFRTSPYDLNIETGGAFNKVSARRTRDVLVPEVRSTM